MQLFNALAEEVKNLGIDTCFGIPGVHNLELYNAFRQANFKIIETTHEQSAAFMADGYARSSGRIAVCCMIDGPGYLNAATGIGQAYSDSVPMLVVTPLLPTDCSVNGRLHELNDQRLISSKVCAQTFEVANAQSLLDVMDQVEYSFSQTRPRPIHVHVPLTAHKEVSGFSTSRCKRTFNEVELSNQDMERASTLLNQSSRPIIVLGGGAINASDRVRILAEKLDAPCLNTVHGKGILPLTHPLRVGGSPSLGCVQEAIRDADVVLAIGTEFGETDFGFFPSNQLGKIKRLIRIDIDREQLNKNQQSQVGLYGDAKEVISILDVETKQRDGSRRVKLLRAAIREEAFVDRNYCEVLASLTNNTDVLVGDSCQPTYHAIWSAEPARPRAYFHSVSGFGTLGYALPASIGAKIANPDKRVTALVGDGGLLYTLSEVFTAVQRKIPIAIVIWNNDGYGEIEKASQVFPNGYRCPRMHVPQYEKIAEGFGASFAKAEDLCTLEDEMRKAHSRDLPTFIQLNESHFINPNTKNWYL